MLISTKKRRLSSGSFAFIFPAKTGLMQNERLSGLVLTQPKLPAIAGRQELSRTFSLRKEVIQPQVLLRLPCYDFTPIMNYTLGGCSSCELAHRLLVQPTFVM